MSEKSREEAIVIRQEEIADGVFSMWLKTDEIAKKCKSEDSLFLFIVRTEAECCQDRSVFVK